MSACCAVALLLAILVILGGWVAFKHVGKNSGKGKGICALALDELVGSKLWMAHEDPPVRVCDGFLTIDEANALISEYEKDLARSNVMQEGGGSAPGPARTSFTAYLPAGDASSDSPALRAVAAAERRAALLLGVPISHLETLQFLRYKEGQRYEPHHDYFKDDAGEKNNRVATALVYLNDLPDGSGGETRFPELGVVVTPSTGRAVLWHNCVARGPEVTCDSRTLHGGDPPKDGAIKYVLNIWARGLPVR